MKQAMSSVWILLLVSLSLLVSAEFVLERREAFSGFSGLSAAAKAAKEARLRRAAAAAQRSQTPNQSRPSTPEPLRPLTPGRRVRPIPQAGQRNPQSENIATSLGRTGSEQQRMQERTRTFHERGPSLSRRPTLSRSDSPELLVPNSRAPSLSRRPISFRSNSPELLIPNSRGRSSRRRGSIDPGSSSGSSRYETARTSPVQPPWNYGGGSNSRSNSPITRPANPFSRQRSPHLTLLEPQGQSRSSSRSSSRVSSRRGADAALSRLYGLPRDEDGYQTSGRHTIIPGNRPRTPDPYGLRRPYGSNSNLAGLARHVPNGALYVEEGPTEKVPDKRGSLRRQNRFVTPRRQATNDEINRMAERHAIGESRYNQEVFPSMTKKQRESNTYRSGAIRPAVFGYQTSGRVGVGSTTTRGKVAQGYPLRVADDQAIYDPPKDHISNGNCMEPGCRDQEYPRLPSPVRKATPQHRRQFIEDQKFRTTAVTNRDGKTEYLTGCKSKDPDKIGCYDQNRHYGMADIAGPSERHRGSGADIYIRPVSQQAVDRSFQDYAWRQGSDEQQEARSGRGRTRAPPSSWREPSGVAGPSTRREPSHRREPSRPRDDSLYRASSWSRDPSRNREPQVYYRESSESRDRSRYSGPSDDYEPSSSKRSSRKKHR